MRLRQGLKCVECLSTQGRNPGLRQTHCNNTNTTSSTYANACSIIILSNQQTC